MPILGLKVARSIIVFHVFNRSCPSCYCLTSHTFCSSAVCTPNSTSLTCSGNNSSNNNNKDHQALRSGHHMPTVVRHAAFASASFCLISLVLPVSCSQYLCPDTHLCVDRPAACPCPHEQDVKCLIPDALDSNGATVVCVRGGNECAEVNRLMKKFSI
jgi:hypothetical protein